MNPIAPEPQASLPLTPPRLRRPISSWLLDIPGLGPLELRATAKGLSALHFVPGDVRFPNQPIEDLLGSEEESDRPTSRELDSAHHHLESARESLEAYAIGTPWAVEPALDLTGVTSFRARVYHRLLQIPFGEVVSYGDLSRDLGKGLAASQAVGQAVGANPVGIFIPCHRVIRSDRALGGFSGGLTRKVQLLRIEGHSVSLPRSDSPVGTELLDLFSDSPPL